MWCHALITPHGLTKQAFCATSNISRHKAADLAQAVHRKSLGVVKIYVGEHRFLHDSFFRSRIIRERSIGGVFH